MACCEDARIEKQGTDQLGQRQLVGARERRGKLAMSGIGEELSRIDALSELGEKRAKG